MFLSYQPDYLKSLYADFPGFYEDITTSQTAETFKGTVDMNILIGAQIKINNMFYIPLFFSFGTSQYDRNLEEYIYVYEGVEYRTPAVLIGGNLHTFFGGGAFINTDIIKGGIYMGYLYGDNKDKGIILPNPSHNHLSDTTYYLFNNHGFKIAFVPLVNTSGWKYVGKALNNILGYLGMGDTVISADDEEDFRISVFANSLNAALDFTFNRFDLSFLGLTAQTIYARGNYDAAAKTDTFGIKLNGLFSEFPFGFTLEGGYKHFYYVAKNFEEDYTDTGYFSGSIYFPLKHLTLGLLYKYDSISNSMFTFALSTNFLSGFLGLGFFDKNSYDKNIYYADGLNSAIGARFRWGGWKAGKE
jgi:hypothetical protein